MGTELGKQDQSQRLFLNHWIDKGLIQHMFIDEIHLPLLELDLRPSYSILPQIVKDLPEIKIVTLSGTLPKNVEDPLKKWMGMESSPSIHGAGLGLDGIPISVVSVNLQLKNVRLFCLDRSMSSSNGRAVNIAAKSV